MIHRRAARRDQNESAIVQALRKAGRIVHRVSGPGLPDLLVSRPDGLWVALEVKRPDGRRTQLQRETNFPVVTTAEDAFVAVGLKAA